MQIEFHPHPYPWRHPKWNQIQLRWFGKGCISRREKNLQDFITTNGFRRVNIIKDNFILDDFLRQHNISEVPADQADAVIITSQQFSRFDVQVMLDKLRELIEQCPLIYFCMNKYYLNGNESVMDTELPDDYDAAIVHWLRKHLPNANITNLTSTFPEDGSWFTWVVPSSEILICKKS